MNNTWVKYILFSILIASLTECCGSTNEIDQEELKIHLSSDMLISENGEGDVSKLLDEQDLQNTNPQTYIDLGRKDFFYPAAIVVDLKQETDVKFLNLYISEQDPLINKDSLKLYSGVPFDWKFENQEITTPIFSDGWIKMELNKKVRYLRITTSSKFLKIYELKILGMGRGEMPTSSKKIQTRTKVKFRDFLGVNALNNDPIGLFDFAGWVREYHNWPWNEKNDSSAIYPKNKYRFNKANGRNFDLFYSNLSARNIEPVPDLKENIESLRPKKWMGWSKPYAKGSNSFDPLSYQAHADFMFQYAARYGSQKVSGDYLKLDDDQDIFSGLNYIKNYENWNEQNMTWKGKDAHFHPFEYAAMSSADLDGHLGALPNNVGLIRADPKAKLIMGGVAGLELEYVKSMKLWFDKYRGGYFPFEAINFHFYAHEGEGDSRKSVSPEDYNLKERMQSIVDYRDKYLPNTKIWMSEFGYDIFPDSPQGVPTSEIYSGQELQAIYLLRTYLILFASGIDRAAMYMMRDAGTGSHGLYASSGLTEDSKHNWKRKTAWYYLSTLSNWLGDLQFDRALEENKDGLYVYRLKSENEKLVAYALWRKDYAQKSYHLNLQSKDNILKEVEFTDLSSFGKVKSLSNRGNGIDLNISDKPILIIESKSKDDLPQFYEEKQVMLDTSMVMNAAKSDRYKIVDEQTLKGNMLYERINECKSIWDNSSNDTYPIEAVIDLKAVKRISRICFNDKPRDGDMEVYYGEPGHWNYIFTDHLRQFKGWSVHSVNINTRYLRIVKKSFGARIGEMVLYEKVAHEYLDHW